MRSSSEVYSLISMKSLTRLGTGSPAGMNRGRQHGLTKDRRLVKQRANAPILSGPGGASCRLGDQVWSIGPDAPGGTACGAACGAAPQLPLTLVVTLGGLPAPCD